MTARRWRIATVVAGVLLACGLAAWPGAAAPPGVQPGRYQIASFPGRAPQFGMEMHGTGCFLVDTATGDLWALAVDAEQRNVWKKTAAGPR